METPTWHFPGSARVLLTTQWTVIADCRHVDENCAREALAELCQTYWESVYLCIRHRGHSAHDAEDLTQEFFLHLLKGKWLEHLDEAKGRFRSYLSVALKNFLHKRWRRAWTLRRGRDCTFIHIEASGVEETYALALATRTTPESLYERQWARVVLEQTLQQLKIEMRAAGKEIFFSHFDAILAANTRNFPYEELAKSINLSVDALHVALHRWRQRYYALMREEIARTVVSKAEVEDELRYLLELFSQDC